MKALTVSDLLKGQKKRLEIGLVTGKSSLGRKITTAEVNRPGLALAGYSRHFRAERIQIIGRGEQSYCKEAPKDKIASNLARVLDNPGLPCLVITRGLRAPAPLAAACRKFRVPLLRSRLNTAEFVGELSAFLEERLAPRIRVHGVLVGVYGLGVLIQGEAGIGKSECALELVKRGHILIADDIVDIHQKYGDVLIGRCAEPIKHFMEVRGLGIIDVKELFGIGSILDMSQIGLSVKLEEWDPGAHYERTGLERRSVRILDVELPTVRIPVSPGRNLAVLIEVAALDQRLKSQGYFGAENFNKSLIAKMTVRRRSRR